jgi:PKHD-type hydroxylase
MSWKYDYFYIKDFFSKKEIINLNKFIDKNYQEIEKLEDVSIDMSTGKSKKKTKSLLIEYKKIKLKLKHLEENVKEINEKLLGYELYNIKDTTNCILNIYDHKIKGEYGWHTDNSRSDIYDCKLTVLINLSQTEYKGGDFYLMNGNEYIVPEFQKPGSVIIIKSFFNHKVTPVLSGERRTLALFLFGPKFR